MSKIGLIGRCDPCGLTTQTWEFYNHLHPAKTLIADISHLNGAKQFPSMYQAIDGCEITVLPKGLPTKKEIDKFLDGLDVVFTCETPYNPYLFEAARERGIKTILQTNFEFCEWQNQPELPKPDVFAAPTSWRFIELFQKLDSDVMVLPVPVNRERLKFQQKTSFRKFLHIAGNVAIHDRNGTRQVMEGFRIFRKMFGREDVTLTVKVQKQVNWQDEFPEVNVEISNARNYWGIYQGYDVLIFPRKYGGLCLPMQEALSCGMPVIMTDISPQNELLPKAWLVPAKKIDQFQAPGGTTDIFEADPVDVARKIWELVELGYDEHEDFDFAKDVNNDADKIANSLDWNRWLPKYQEILTHKAPETERIPVHWIGGKGNWNHGMLMEILDDWKFKEVDSLEGIKGAIIIDRTPEEVVGAEQEKTLELLKGLDWYIFIYTEECNKFDFSRLPGKHLVYAMHHNTMKIKPDRVITLGTRADTKEILSTLTGVSLPEKFVTFVGQVQNENRKKCAEVLTKYGGSVIISEGFGASVSGLNYEAYLQVLLNSKIVLCPMGNVSPDTIRVYETIEAGALPIVENPDYWKPFNILFPCVKTWDELPAILDKYKAEPELLKQYTEKTKKWWEDYKGQLVKTIQGDVKKLSS